MQPQPISPADYRLPAREKKNMPLTPEKIARNYVERLAVCPRLEADSNEDIAAFEEVFTPMNKYAGYGHYTFNSPADEQRACAYSHAHFLLNRCLTYCVRLLRAANIELHEFSDFNLHIKETVPEKLDTIIRCPPVLRARRKG